MMSRRSFMQFLGLGALSSSLLGSYAVAVEPLWRLNIVKYRLQPDHWPRGLKLRIAILADLHACEPWMRLDRIAQIVARTNALEPDITLLLGDFSLSISPLLASPLPASDWAGVLAGLEAPLGRYAVLGNHDWLEDDTAQQRGHGPIMGQMALEKAGIPVLENAARQISHAGQHFWLAGLGDQLALLSNRRLGRRRRQGVDDLPATLKAANDGAPIILMAHEPDIFPDVLATDAPVALTVSGHTHGGQFRLFNYAPVVPSRFGNRYAYGHITEPRKHGGTGDLLVSGGLGCSIAPIRFGIPPEIVLIELG